MFNYHPPQHSEFIDVVECLEEGEGVGGANTKQLWRGLKLVLGLLLMMGRD